MGTKERSSDQQDGGSEGGDITVREGRAGDSSSPSVPARGDDAPPKRVDTLPEQPLAVGPTAIPPRKLKHDPRELRRRIAMAFSAGELSKFGERWRVFIDREGSADDGARQLVKALENRGKIPQLVESLAAHKPLIEWPEPTIEVEEEPPPAAALPVAEAATAKAPAPSATRDPIVDPMASVAIDRAPAGAVVIPRRWLVGAGAALTALALGGVVWWAFGGGSSSNETASLALDAAAELARSVAAVRSACDVEEDEEDSARDELKAAFRRCSRPTIRPSRIDVPLPPSPKPAPDPGPIARPARPSGPVSRRPGCLDQCHQIHNQCKKTQCGSEPASAADYETYQRCLAGCLSQYSRCRLTCR